MSLTGAFFVGHAPHDDKRPMDCHAEHDPRVPARTDDRHAEHGLLVRLAENAIDWIASFPGDYEYENRCAEYDGDA